MLHSFAVLKKIFNHTLFRFLVTGGLGTLVNLLIFYWLADLHEIKPSVASVAAFVFVVGENYLINHYWSFRRYVDYPISVRGYLKYAGVNVVGLMINLAVLQVVLYFFSPQLKVVAQFSGILLATGFNYFGAKNAVFYGKKQ